jgi:hypothetical protein
MTLGPWLIWVPLLALINLLAFVAIRGRWGRSVLVLGLASVAGVVIGDWIGQIVALDLVRIGDMNVVAASIGAQVLMVAVTLLAALGPVRMEEPRVH